MTVTMTALQAGPPALRHRPIVLQFLAGESAGCTALHRSGFGPAACLPEELPRGVQFFRRETPSFCRSYGPMRECHRAWTSSRSAWTSCRTAAHRTALQVSWLTAAPRPHVAEAGRCEDDVGLKLTKSTDAQQEYECSGRKCQHPAQKSTAPAARKGLEAVKPHHGNGFVWHWSPEVWAWDPAAGPWEARYGGPRAPVYFEVSNAHVAPAQAYEFWCAHAFYNFEPDPPRAAEKFAFRAEARSLYSPRAQLHTYRSDPIAGSRSKRHAKADSGTLIDIGLVISGRRRLAPNLDDPAEKRHVFGPGEFYVYDPAQPCRSEWDAHTGLHLTVRKDMLAAAFEGDVPSSETLLRTLNSSHLSLFVRSQLTQLSRDLPHLSMAEKIAVLENTVDLIIALCRINALQQKANRRDISNTPTPFLTETMAGLFVAARRYIHLHLGNPALSPDVVARAIGCSRATLYRIFEAEGFSPAQFIREERLALAQHLLEEAPTAVSVTEIAHRCGFRDSAHFSKLFKRRFGCNPTEARRSRIDQHNESTMSDVPDTRSSGE